MSRFSTLDEDCHTIILLEFRATANYNQQQNFNHLILKYMWVIFQHDNHVIIKGYLLHIVVYHNICKHCLKYIVSFEIFLPN